MKTTIPGLVGVWLVALAAAADAADSPENGGRTGLYVIADAGVNFVQNVGFKSIAGVDVAGTEVEIDPGARATLGVGWAFVPDWSVELESGVACNETKTSSPPGNSFLNIHSARVWVVPVTVGLTWRPTIAPQPKSGIEIEYGQKFLRKAHPYIGAGFGGATFFGEFKASSPFETLKDSGSDTVFSFYAKAGLTWDVTSNVELGVQYRFSHFSGFTIKQTESEDILAHTVSAALRFKF